VLQHFLWTRRQDDARAGCPHLMQKRGVEATLAALRAGEATAANG